MRLGSTACKCGTSHERIGPRCTVRRACGACACGGCSSVGAHTPHRSTAARSALQTAVGIRIYRPTQAPPDRRARMPRRYSAHRPLRPAPVRALDSHPPRRFLRVGTESSASHGAALRRSAAPMVTYVATRSRAGRLLAHVQRAGWHAHAPPGAHACLRKCAHACVHLFRRVRYGCRIRLTLENTTAWIDPWNRKLPSGSRTGLHASKPTLFVIRVSQILLRYEQLVHE